MLAVLLCRKPTPGAPNQFYRGMNLEVSMPTGTLCAERNAIGEFVRSARLLRRASLHTCSCALIAPSTDFAVDKYGLIRRILDETWSLLFKD